MGYIEELRALVGTKPLVLTGVTVLVIDRHSRFLMVESDKPDEDEIQKVQFFKWSAFPEDLCERDRQIFQSFIENLISKGMKG
jgi:hypothetical protein